ncbi:MAG TPA: DUF111 family protein [bacterium (Candidatus Stahlbacteria)]|nr:DUF111 family protein [Candidatus Stahlbacteria bacterium]
MKILYIDPIFGASGDMLISALIDTGLDLKVLEDGFQNLKIGRVVVKRRKVTRCGIRATKVHFEGGRKIKFDRFLTIIERSRVDRKVKERTKRILQLISRTETSIHGRSHRLHELDDLDTLLDGFGFSLAINHLGIDQVYCGLIGIGQGAINIAHGTMPSFTYFASRILAGYKLYHHNISSEILTPTGAAIIATCARPAPEGLSYRFDSEGLGAGQVNFEDHPNILRIIVGSIDDEMVDQVSIVKTNIDDAKPLIYEKLFEEIKRSGGLDIYLTPYSGRKQRIGTEITVITRPGDSGRIARVLLKHTPTLGVRVIKAHRKILKRKIRKLKTPLGEVRVKISSGYGVRRISIEYDDLKRIADLKGLPLEEVERKINLEINRIYYQDV